MKKIEWAATILVIALIFFYIYIFAFTNYADFPRENISKIEISNNTVIEVIDGDTFKLANNETVRLICVDTPEKGKNGYEEAKIFLSSLVLNKEIILQKDISDKDAYGRLLRYVYVGDIFVNKEIVSNKYGAVFRYGNDTSRCNEIVGLK
jgi:endonuclease YncB( thermonuclease family)